MIRNDIYALYQGKEYEVISSLENEKRTYQLRSLDPEDLKNGFLIYKRPEYVLTSKGDKFYLPPRDPDEPDIYLKDITSCEVDEVYDVSTFGYYEGHLVVINAERENAYYLGVPENQALARKLGFEEIDRGVLRKWVPKEKVERIFEEKCPLPHFFGS